MATEQPADLEPRAAAHAELAEAGEREIRLDHAIGVMAELARRCEASATDDRARVLGERLHTLAHEMRNLLNTAIVAVCAIREGRVGFGGATAAALDRSLMDMRRLVDRTLAQANADNATPAGREAIEIATFLLDVQVVAALEGSRGRGEIILLPVDRGIRVAAEREVLASALAILLRNACRFAHVRSQVLLRGYVSGTRVLLEVEDECGGLDQNAERAVACRLEGGGPKARAAGLVRAREAVEACGGMLRMRNVPGRGCIFTIDLPRCPDRDQAARRVALPGTST